MNLNNNYMTDYLSIYLTILSIYYLCIISIYLSILSHLSIYRDIEHYYSIYNLELVHIFHQLPCLVGVCITCKNMWSR